MKNKKEKILILNAATGKMEEDKNFIPEIKTQEPKYINELLDRSKINAKTKKEIKDLFKKSPELKPILEILIGKKELGV